MQRYVSLDICDYTNTPLCNLYDSANDLSGQAVNIVIHSERNGFKQISFTLPSSCFDEEGEKENYRLDYLISDYRLKYQKRNESGRMETDWFLISESKITHNAFSKDYEVVASHISHLLKTKNLDLEFSDDEGNNTGTIEQIAEAILEGTGWHIGIGTKKFYEDKKYTSDTEKEKVRSFTSSSNTGAFKMISDLCELFDAKPIYHGEGQYISYNEETGQNEILTGRTVDIIPMNPFSKDLETGAIPKEVLEGEGVLELHYDKSIKTLTRTLNTENIVTKLSAYGSYGDRTGMCSLQNATHAELTFDSVMENVEYRFDFLDSTYFFTATANSESPKWSYLDYVSRSYVYDGENLFEVYKQSKTNQAVTLNYEVEYVKNYFPFIMDFSYYRSVGLLNDAMLLALAEYQHVMPEKYIIASEASISVSDSLSELTNNSGGDSGFAKLSIADGTVIDGNVVLTLNKTSDYPDGIIYRSDYTVSKRNSFGWYTASGLRENGMALSGKGSIIYIIHETTPISWEKAYVKSYGNGTDNYYRDNLGNTYQLHVKNTNYNSYDELILHDGTPDIIYIVNDTKKMYVWFNNGYQEIKAANYNPGENQFDEPLTITLWSSTYKRGDHVFLFSADDIAGLFGPREDAIYANKAAVQESVKQGSTEVHPVDFIVDNDIAPSSETAQAGYAWYYRSFSNTYDLGDLYFCWGNDGDNGWYQVYISKGNENPEELSVHDYKYYYHINRKMLYKLENNVYIPVKDSVNKDRMTSYFAAVVKSCIKHEILTKGVSEEYYYVFEENELPKGNYAFKNEYDNYWLFSTDRNISASTGQLKYYSKDKTVWQDNDDNHILKATENSFDILEFPVNNELYGRTFTEGSFDQTTYVVSREGNKKVTAPIYIHDNIDYEFYLPDESIIVFNDSNNKVLEYFIYHSSLNVGGETVNYTKNNPFVYRAPNHTSNIALIAPSVPTSEQFIRVKDYDKVLFQKDTMYKILPCVAAGEKLGLYYLMNRFITLAHETFEVKLPELKAAQNYILDKTSELAEMLGDMYREGKWQDSKYAEGSENELYADALDNLKETSHPDATYEFTYIDLYGADKHSGYSVSEESEEIDWPEIDISYAAHLVDTDLDTNCWAYIDKIDECIDKPWETKIEIDTKLSTMGQQSFTDVISRIAEVANETKANQALYKRAAVLSGSGMLAAERLEGAISANRVLITGGPSNWYTDDKGNIIFESEDSSSAMMLTGQGWAISNKRNAEGDWDFRYMATGEGMTADAIYTGYLSAERLEAGSITTDKLSATLGSELDIGSNVALNLFATEDGSRPAGGVNTPHNEGDSYITIAAKQDDIPAHIDIKTGGKLNIEGSSVSVTSNSSMTFDAGGSINISSNGKFLVSSENFSITEDATGQHVVISGDLTAQSGNIGGFTIGTNVSSGNHYMYAGNLQALTDNGTGIYLGSDGINIGNRLIVKSDGTSTVLKTTAQDIQLGNKTLAETLEDLNTTYRASKANMLLETGFKVGDTWSDSESQYGYTYVCIKDYDINYTEQTFDEYWTLTGTSLLGGAAIAINADTGAINLTAANTITALAGSNITIAANNTVSILTNGSITIGKGVKPFTIGATDGTNGHAYIYNGVTSFSDTSHDGIYLGTDGITLGKGLFKVGTDGKLTCTSADVSGTITATDGKIANWFIKSGFVANANTISTSTTGLGDSTYAYWAGKGTSESNIANSKFYVKNDGTFKATSATIEGKITSSDVSITGGSIEIKNGSTTYFKASSSGAEIKGTLRADSLYIGNNNVISGSKISLTSDTFAGIGTSSSALQITNNSIVVRSGGTIDLSAAGTINLSYNKLSDKPNIFTVPTGVTIAEGQVKVYSGSNYVDITTAGVYAKGTEIKLDATSTNNHVYLTPDGIDIKGNRLTFTDESGTYEAWARDDIIILKRSDDEQTIINNMTDKHDWVLIKPYYSAIIKYSPNSGYFNLGRTTGRYATMMQESGSALAFGSNASWYKYHIAGHIKNNTGSYQRFTTTAYLSNTPITSRTEMQNTNVKVAIPIDISISQSGDPTYEFETTESGQNAINLCTEDATVYLYIDLDNSIDMNMYLQLTCSCSATTSKVPCTVYYFP